ncbi:hypothetical protein ERJ75_000895900 [Trypanosoma vivax]|nr:hypothetical protein ERJ75_000895900 [Trypanosoma vivax]
MSHGASSFLRISLCGALVRADFAARRRGGRRFSVLVPVLAARDVLPELCGAVLQCPACRLPLAVATSDAAFAVRSCVSKGSRFLKGVARSAAAHAASSKARQDPSCCPLLRGLLVQRLLILHPFRRPSLHHLFGALLLTPSLRLLTRHLSRCLFLLPPRA